MLTAPINTFSVLRLRTSQLTEGDHSIYTIVNTVTILQIEMTYSYIASSSGECAVPAATEHFTHVEAGVTTNFVYNIHHPEINGGS